jgi:4-hydroxybenzoate polyprenyltransferase
MYPTIATAALIAATSGRHFSVGPWIIVPILILAAIIGTIIYVVKDRQNRRSRQPVPRNGSS